jgi:hypothetical protein
VVGQQEHQDSQSARRDILNGERNDDVPCRNIYAAEKGVQLATLIVLLASLAVNLLVLRQNWNLKSRVFRLESVVYPLATTNSTRSQSELPRIQQEFRQKSKTSASASSGEFQASELLLQPCHWRPRLRLFAPGVFCLRPLLPFGVIVLLAAPSLLPPSIEAHTLRCCARWCADDSHYESIAPSLKANLYRGAMNPFNLRWSRLTHCLWLENLPDSCRQNSL